MIRELIREKITKKYGDVIKFSADENLRTATVYDFLNDTKKNGVTFSTFQKIIQPLGISIMDSMPSKFVEVPNILVNGENFKKGNVFRGKEIFKCLGSPDSAHQAVLFRSGENFELIVV